MTPNGLGLDTANPTQGLELIPSGTLVTLAMRLKAGTTGIEALLKRTAKGDAEMLDVEYVVQGGPYAGRKIFQNLILDGITSGHAKAAEISRSFLRAVLESIHNVAPDDNSPTAIVLRAGATLAGFHGATFLATIEIEKGGKRPDGSNYRDRNVIGRVLRIGDQGYRKLEQPPPAPIERSAPSVQPQTTAPPAHHGSPAVAVGAIPKPSWAS